MPVGLRLGNPDTIAASAPRDGVFLMARQPMNHPFRCLSVGNIVNKARRESGLSENGVRWRIKHNIPIDSPIGERQRKCGDGARIAHAERVAKGRAEAAAIAAEIDARKAAIKTAQAIEPTEGDDD